MFYARYSSRSVEMPAPADWAREYETVDFLTCYRGKDCCYYSDLPGCFGRRRGGGCLILQTAWLDSVRSSCSACGLGE